MSIISRYAHCLFCDAVRLEVGNKLSFMGVYSDELKFTGGPPGKLPTFAIIVWARTPSEDPFDDMLEICLNVPGQEVVTIQAEMTKASSATPTEVATMQTIHVMFNATNFQMDVPGTIEVEVDTGREKLLAGRLKVIFPDAATTQDTSDD